MATIELQKQNLEVFENAVLAMAQFKAAFGRGLSADLVAEIYAAEALNLKAVGLNQPGYDALGPGGERYQIKHRAAQTLTVNVNNFDFDFLVLVNLDDDYRLGGMWRISQAQAKQLFVERPQFGKHQVTQRKFKSVAEVIQKTKNSSHEKNGQSATQPSRRGWHEVRGAAPFPLVGEDAQQWVSRTRREDDAQGGLSR